MKRALLFAGSIGVLLSALAADQLTSPYTVKMFEVPDTEKHLLSDYRSTWTRLTGFEYSGLHWNQFITVYTDKGGETYQNNYVQYITWYEDPDEFDGPPSYAIYPQGTTILKENFSVENGKPGESLTVTAMVKKAPGYDAANGDWEYLQFDAKGQVLLRGNSSDPVVEENCAGCHRHVAERDYIFSQVYSAAQRE